MSLEKAASARSAATTSTAFAVTGLTVRYPGFTLGPLDLSLERGFVMGLVGANGAGKTILIRTLLGMVHPTAGAVEVLGRPVDAHVGGVARVGVVTDAPPCRPWMRVEEAARVARLADPVWDAARFDDLAEQFGLRPRGHTRAVARHGYQAAGGHGGDRRGCRGVRPPPRARAPGRVLLGNPSDLRVRTCDGDLAG